MNLNALERKFFDRILNAELGVPVHATLEYQTETFPIIIVPEIEPDGYFRLKYYNAPAYNPEPRHLGHGAFAQSWSGSAVFGTHPLFEQAWLESDPVTVVLHSSPMLPPIGPRENLKLDAKVLYAAHRHRGALALDKNLVTVQNAPLKKAEFCIVDFPKFVTPDKQRRSTAGIGAPEREMLESVASRLEDDATIDIWPPEHHVILDSGDGWNIRLTRDEQQARDLVSHTGLIEKSDGGEFGTDELDDLLEGLKYFFAFVAGAYCYPTVVIGYDSQSRPVWGQIGRFEMDRHHPTNWFNNGDGPLLGANLEALFYRFWFNWNAYKDAFAAIIECYVHSNAMRKAGVPKDAVAKSYAGLEILTSLKLRKTIKNNPGAEIHKVLEDYAIPHLRLKEPGTPSMSKLSENLRIKASKGSDLLNSVRNYVAHPLDPHTQALIKQGHLDYLEADPKHYVYLHDLSQFYLEYAFLKFCGYETYDHRLLLETQQQV